MSTLALAAALLSLAAAPSRGSRAAIDATLDRLYPGQKDFRMGLMAAPGEDKPPLAEVVAYRGRTTWRR
jgi:hypothetical protein